MGIWVDDASLRLAGEQGCRVGVLEVVRGAPGIIWAAVAPALPVSDLFRAFGDGIRGIHALRPLHHRDVSVYNLLVNEEALHDGAEEERRMEAKLAWENEDVAPRLVTSIIDYDRSRFGDDPSDILRRKAARASSVVDPDMSFDDAITGTIPFTSRAQAMLMRVGEGKAHQTLINLVKQEGRHRHWHWHDVESLCFCVIFAFFSRYESVMRLGEPS